MKNVKLPSPKISAATQAEIKAHGFRVYESPCGLRVAGEQQGRPVDMGLQLFEAILRSGEAHT